MAGSMLMVVSACAPTAIEPPVADVRAVARGKAAAVRLGCGACHDMPGVGWPKGTIGPSLAGIGDRALIAGKVPNGEPQLAAFVRDAPSQVPESGMPAVPMTSSEARDIAAWLRSLRD
ncbi:cytochrome c1 [Sphingopyxis sp. OAS728]|uniref:c-type cytochrome n=1 Tax=Sphingopyxis sp. OAS728 TaxID=2663823 RepID=UPI001A01364A|nr:c-type cytochrome [Sphingopyxis sp. OAS728]MBE1529878.1 cytochrome c1 [Sphingopyxis sp. OAS728]